MTRSTEPVLSKREREVMDIVYRCNEATAKQIHAQMPDPPTYTSVRSLLRTLVDKGHLRHHHEGVRYVYTPTVPLKKARDSAITRVLTNFFSGSRQEMIASLIDEGANDLSDEDLKTLSELIKAARKEGR
ncbi:MAG: BlaI/MecI/CopY family transcriptional regulator [Pseudomonadales bacterium]|nr:BlaI/MecI/CopY family transcriptional regulator [Pseudomonadales bacterium]